MEGINRAGRNEKSSFSKRIRVRFEVTRFAFPILAKIVSVGSLMVVFIYMHRREEDVVCTINEPTGSVRGWHDERSELFSLSIPATSSDSLLKESADCNILHIFLISLCPHQSGELREHTHNSRA